jgi:hypothetical protein
MNAQQVISIAAVALLIPLSGCRSMFPADYVSLKDTAPVVTQPKLQAKAPFALGPVVVAGSDRSVALAIEKQMTTELAGRGYSVSPAGRWQIRASMTGQTITWRVIDDTGSNLGWVSQNYQPQTGASTLVAAAAPSLVTYFPSP